ncbi:MAG: peptidoglycan DD-metalloendopeptidase family protein [Thermodesulfobacteria bacterium]|nr:peptidoglycan DD-metalloendopeptidase family protein [Thermodesulfobacteriota bacterium]
MEDIYKLKKVLIPAIKSYSAVLFNNSLWVGLGILALTFVNPNLGIGGLTAVISAYAFARFAGFKEEFLRLEYYIYNPLLVGLALGYLFRADLISIIIFVIAGLFTFLLTYFLANVCGYYLGLPILSVPFVIATSLFYLASLKFSNLFVTSLYPHHHLFLPIFYKLPLCIQGYLRALGAIFFLPYIGAGLIMFLLLLGVSRILAFLSLLGYFSGVLVKWLLTGSYIQAVSDTASFNYILISMAIGGVFLIPSISSYRLACLSAIIAVPVVEGARVFWENFGISVFALPFNAVTLLLLYVLTTLRYPKLTRLYKGTPERTLDHFMTYCKRFPFEGRYIRLPFSGRWTVWQGFEGEWTHKGPWRYAVDFVITDEEGNTHQNEGYYLTDYYAFGKPVLSPVEGQVVEVINNIPDNPPGKPDRERNWGNYVLIYDKRGFYVLICHFKEGSIKVKQGDYVVPGTLLGLCGNSGYSPQPHIHIHVQLVPTLGAPTVPFSFSSYILGDRFIDIGIPKEGEIVEPVFQDKALYNKLNMFIDLEMKYKIRQREKEKEFKVIVKMAPDGTFYLTDGKAKLYFGIQNSTFYFYHLEGNINSPLRYFFFTAPKIPLFYKKGLKWNDYLPLLAVSSGWKRAVYLFLSSFKSDLFEVKLKSTYVEETKISSLIEAFGETISAELELAQDYGFKRISWADEVIIEKID